MRTKSGIVLMLLGAALIIAALSLFLHNQREDQVAETAVEQTLPQVQTAVEQAVAAQEAGEPESLPDPYDPEMTVVEIDGYGYVGYLSIPAIEQELPVMADWSDEQLKLSPCRYSGSTKTDNLVIAAHNLTGHFRRLSELTIGDSVVFVDMDGVVSCYEVASLEVLEPSDVEEMIAGEYPLTLFTCTNLTSARLAVRCVEITQ